MLIANLANALSQWTILLVIANILGAEGVGTYAVCVSLLLPIFAFCGMELRSVIVTDAKQEFPNVDYFGLRCIGMTVGLLAAILIAFFFNQARLPYALIMVVALTHVVDGITDILHGRVQQLEQMRLIAISVIVKGGLSLLLMLVFFVNSHNLTMGCTGLLIARVCVLLFWDTRVLMSHAPRDNKIAHEFSPSNAVAIAKQSLPFTFLEIIRTCRLTTPRLLIWFYMGAADLGVFAIVLTMMGPFEILFRSIYQSAFPRISKLFHISEHKQVRSILKSLLTGNVVATSLLAILCLWCGSTISDVAFNVNHKHLGVLLACMALTTGLRASLRSCVIVCRSLRQTSVLIVIHSLELILTIAACWFGVCNYGLAGAITGMLAASFVASLVAGFCLSRKLSMAELQSNYAVCT